MTEEWAVRPTRMYVNLDAIAHNVRTLKEKLRPQTGIMAVIKASGYGSGAVNIVNTMLDNGVSRVAVAITEEGIQLRDQGADIPILILTQPLSEDLQRIIEYNLTPAIAHWETAEKLDHISRYKNVVTAVHVEVDTGMGRIGIPAEEAVQFVERLALLRNIYVEGIFTHFACSDSDTGYTKFQIGRFEKVLAGLEAKAIDIPLKHACNSAAILNYPEAHYDLVRPGLMLYGYYPDQNLKKKIDLRPSLALKSKVVFVKEVPIGTSISYNRKFVAGRVSKIATIPIGYADGYRRELSNKGFVVINGIRAPIVGAICMDMLMADVTHLPEVKPGDDVVLFDEENITVEELAALCGTINYEIISTISDRVPRITL